MDSPLADESAPSEDDPLAILRAAQEGAAHADADPSPLASATPPASANVTNAQSISQATTTPNLAPHQSTDEPRSVEGSPPHDDPSGRERSSGQAALTPSRTLDLKLDAVPRVQFVMHANDVEVLRSIRLENTGDEPLHNLVIKVHTEPAFAPDITFTLDELRPGAIRTLEPKWRLDASFLDRLNERTEGSIEVEVHADDRPIANQSSSITVFTRNEWPGDIVYPELLAAFVLPNEPAVEALLHEAGKILQGWTGSPTIDGYQRDTPESAQQQVAAIYSALASMGLQYVSPPASFESAGQRVRLPEKIAGSKQGACLDLTLFTAAAIEAAGLHPIVVIIEGHAFCGAFLSERSWSDSTTDDIARLRNDIKVGDLVVFETTSAVAGNASSFEAAVQSGLAHLRNDSKFRLAVDVRRARRGGIRPMSTLSTDNPVQQVSVEGFQASTTFSAPDAAELQRTRQRREAERGEVERGPARIENWKRKLLDMTLRNRLLNIPAKGKFVKLLIPDVAEFEDLLADGGAYSITSRPDEVLGEGEVREGGARLKRTEEELRELLTTGIKSGLLYASQDAETLDKRLTALRREARVAEEEGGSSNLYLTIGLLKFFESDKSEKARFAPVILVPVQLEQRTASEGVRLSARAEDARINVTLLRYLESQYEVRIDGVDPPPDDGNGLDVPKVFHKFREEIRAKRGWEIVEEARLGMFSFAKFLIWRDLEEYAERLLESKVVEHLVSNSKERYVDGVDFRDPSELDKIAKSTETFVPMSADSSQLSAIVAAAEGKSFVLIGPPGTGKSQTITNLITHCLATGKTVLFVSEKMAALEVVHRRLSQVGLAERCLELHSGKANKKEVLAQLDASLRSSDKPSVVYRDVIARDLDKERDRLNGYVQAMHNQRPSGDSVFQALTRLIGLGEGQTVDLGWSAIADTTADKLEQARRTTVEAQAGAVEAQVGPAHPLREIGHTEFSPLWEERASKSLSDAIEALGKFRDTEAEVAGGLLGTTTVGADSRNAFEHAQRLLLEAPRLGREALTSSEWNRQAEEARDAFRFVEGLRTERAHFEARYARAVADIDQGTLLAALDQAEAKWFLPRFFARRAWSKRFAATTTPKETVDLVTARAELERMGSFKAKESELDERRERLEHVFGDEWKAERSNVEELEATLGWIGDVRAVAEEFAVVANESAEALLERWTRLLADSGRMEEPLSSAMVRYPEERQAAVAAANDLAGQLLPQDEGPWIKLEPATCLEVAQRWSEGWSREHVRTWCRWQAVRKPALDAQLEALVLAVESGEVAPQSMSEVLERSFAEVWYKHTISADPALRDFESQSHVKAIEKFRSLDDQLLRATHEAVQARIAANQRSKDKMVSGVQGGFLRREIQKKSRHRPIRTLFKEAGDLIRELRPCVLMSPLSVAQFLDPSLPRFDVVVFDEASQMPVWDAIGAIARGNQVIVVGDPKQLPPTNFFGKTVSDDDAVADEEEEVIEDLESVLDECLASNIDQHLLSWHYRSRHESLIAFSNRNYYDGKLITFPAAVNDGIGVSWRPVPDGVYDFGKSRTNQREAEEVVTEIVRRLKDPELSKATIGVVALSQAQQMRVEDLLDKARREHPEIEPFFSSDCLEPVFVKNLENVQGDERDVILFTVCYGPDLTSKVRMNFGPLNKEGGWRRLNVAITRARREVLVFSTLRADQIDLNRSKASGVRDLRRFLEFAERGTEAFAAELETDLTAEHDSPFEQEVCAELVRRGFTVHRQVGCSGYRVDLAIVDPEFPGRYLLGIECDGASYHSAPSARDRDKLRQELLEGLGWTLHRIWSTDWWENREREIEECVAAIEHARTRRDAQMAAAAAVAGGSLTTSATSELDSDLEADGSGSPDELRGLIPDNSDRLETSSTREESEPTEQASSPLWSIGKQGAAEVTASNERAEELRVAESPMDLNDYPESAAERVEWVIKAMRQDPDRYKGRLEFYGIRTGQPAGHRDDFYDPRCDSKVAQTLKTTVGKEGPILAELAAYRVGALWGFSHLKSRGVKRVLDCHKKAGVHLQRANGEKVLWPTKESQDHPVVPRIGSDEESQRSIDQIPLIELAALLHFWIDEAGPMTEKDLFDHTIRSIGLQKLGKNIRLRLEKALAMAKSAGSLNADGDYVRAR